MREDVERKPEGRNKLPAVNKVSAVQYSSVNNTVTVKGWG